MYRTHFLVFLLSLQLFVAGCSAAVGTLPATTPLPSPTAPAGGTRLPLPTPSPQSTAVPAATAPPEPSPGVVPSAPGLADLSGALNCRFGIAKGFAKERVDWIEPLGAGHYMNFTTTVSALPETVELLPLIRIKQDKENGVYLPTYSVKPPLTLDQDGLGPIIAANPRALWIVGNEPDVANDVQDNTFPEVYARAYHDVYHFIKQQDPDAQVAVAGLSMMTPGRLQYLDIVWDSYLAEFGEPMPVDVWNTHLYILSEIRQSDGGSSDGKIALGTDPDLAKKNLLGDPQTECPREDVYCRSEHDDLGIFSEQITALRSWMKAHGQQNKPLLVTEYSLLYPFVDYDDPVNPTECFLMDEFGRCFTEERVSTFLDKTIDYFESAVDPELGYPADGNRLVQQWTWFSLLTDVEGSGGSSNLIIEDHDRYQPGAEAALTQAGRTFRDRAAASEKTINLVAAAIPERTVTTAGAAADVQLRAGFYNDGTTAVLDPFTVTFYADEALTKVIGERTVLPAVQGAINGCSWGRETDSATIIWKDVPAGVHPFWVKVDAVDQISGETSETDNAAGGIIIVSP